MLSEQQGLNYYLKLLKLFGSSKIYIISPLIVFIPKSNLIMMTFIHGYQTASFLVNDKLMKILMNKLIKQ